MTGINARDLGYTFFESETRMILEVTKALNELGKTGALENEHHYISVSLKDTEGTTLGIWLDEIDATDWQFTTVNSGTKLSKEGI